MCLFVSSPSRQPLVYIYFTIIWNATCKHLKFASVTVTFVCKIEPDQYLALIQDTLCITVLHGLSLLQQFQSHFSYISVTHNKMGTLSWKSIRTMTNQKCCRISSFLTDCSAAVCSLLLTVAGSYFTAILLNEMVSFIYSILYWL